jgi:hypothetical protein
MPGRHNFVAGCGAGMLATLVLATFLLPTQRRRRRSKEEYSDFPQHPPVEADRQAAVDAGRKGKFDEQSNLQLGSTPSALEYQTQTHGDLELGGSKVVLPGDPRADVVAAVVHPGTRVPWHRRFKATDRITAAAAMILAVAVTYFGIAFQKQMKNVTAQLIQSEITMRAMQEGVRGDERAWVGLTETVVQPLTSDGGGFTIKLQNTGKTPALDLQISDVITMEEVDQSEPLHEPNITAHNFAGTLMPVAVYMTDVWFKTSPDTMYRLTHDQLSAVNFVRLTYKDVLQRPHTTKVCFTWRSSLPRLKPCDNYNEMD